MAPNEIVDRLNGVLPMGLRAYAAAKPVHKAADIASAAYEVRLALPNTSAPKAVQILEAFFAQPEIIAETDEKGEREISLKSICTALPSGGWRRGAALCKAAGWKRTEYQSDAGIGRVYTADGNSH